jgi:parvulin-like peptidyl-prolyl isomerase
MNFSYMMKLKKKILHYFKRLKRKNYLKLKIKRHLKKFLRNRRVVKIFLLVTIATILILIAKSMISGRNYDVVVAKINGQKIYKLELEQKLREIIKEQNPKEDINGVPEIKDLPKDTIEILVKQIYIDKEIDKKIQNLRIIESQEVKNKVSDYKNKLLREEFLNSLIKYQTSDNNVRDKYIALVDEMSGKKEYAISHILLGNKESAENIFNQLRSSYQLAQDFSNLAHKYSLDKSSAENGGKIGYVLQTRLDEQMSKIIVTMKKGDIAKPFESKYGWHIIKLDDIREARILPFESAKEDIRQKIKGQVIKNYYSKIVENSKIEILLKNYDDSQKKSPKNKK